MYPYHNKIKQRIRNGELADYYFTDSYPGIGEAMVLVFSTEPFKKPIRPYRFPEYFKLLHKYLPGLIVGESITLEPGDAQFNEENYGVYKDTEHL